MANDSRKPITSHAVHTVAFLTSLIVHVSLLILLACWILAHGSASQGVLLIAHQADSLDANVEFSLLPEIERQPEAMPQPPEIEPPQLALTVNPLPNTSAQKGPRIPASLTSIMAADMSKSLTEPLKKRGAAFFGAYAEGNRFVFVLDSSRSMLEDDRWTYACNQLIDSLNGLQPEQEFFVICFDVKTTLLFNVPAAKIEFQQPTDDTIAKVKRWLRSRQLGRATMPMQALHYALKLGPDAIFLLSDGELQDDSIGMLRMLNGFSSEYRQVPIHTVHLFSEQGKRTLEVLAIENAGTFTPVQK